MEEFFNSIRWSEIWPVIVVLVAAPLLLMGGGAVLIAGAQYCDEKWVGVLRGVAWVTGARWQAEGFWKQTLRWFIFLTWFVFIFGLAGWDNGLPAGARIALIGLGYLLALAVGRTWVSEETRLLNGQSDKDELSNQMRPMAIFSFVFLLALIPMSFDVANGFQWFKGAEGYRLKEWGLATVDLLLKVVVDFLELLDLKASTVNVEYQSWPGAALVLMHFCTLAYVVVSGVSLIAQGDHATRSDLERLKRGEGDPSQLIRQGGRVLRSVVSILIKPDANTTVKGQSAAAEVIGRIAERNDGKLPDYALRALVRASTHKEFLIRYRAAEALGRVSGDEAKGTLLQMLKSDAKKGVIEKAGMSLRNRQFPQPEFQALLDFAKKLAAAPKPSLEAARREAIARILSNAPSLAKPAWVRVGIDRWKAEEVDPGIQSLLEGVLAFVREQGEQENTELEIREKLQALRHPSAHTRTEATRSLARFMTDSRVPEVMLSQLNVEKYPFVRYTMICALHENKTGSANYERKIVASLRHFLTDEHPSVRAAACEGLAKFLPPMASTKSRLNERVNTDQDDEVQEMAVISLSDLGDLQAIKRLVERRKAAGYVPQAPSNPLLVEQITEILRERFQEDAPEVEPIARPSRLIQYRHVEAAGNAG